VIKNFCSIEHAKVDKETQQKVIKNTLATPCLATWRFGLAARCSRMIVWRTKPCARKQRVCSSLQSYDSWKKNLQIDERKQPAIKNGRPKLHKEVCQTRILKLEDENDERSAGQQTRDDTSKVWILLRKRRN
jgi:hypothetical protein